MILVDVNLLIYAYDSGSRRHEKSRRWLEEVFSKPEPVGLAWITIVAFLRITTNPRILERPFAIAEAAAEVDEWLDRPNVTVPSPTRRHWEILRELLPSAQARGPLAVDAHLAALAIEHGATLCSTDRDFTRFEGLAWHDPIAEST